MKLRARQLAIVSCTTSSICTSGGLSCAARSRDEPSSSSRVSACSAAPGRQQDMWVSAPDVIAWMQT